MAAPTVGVCSPWCDDAAVQACCGGLSPEVDPQTITNAILMASNALFRLTGRQFPGLCTIEAIRPCSSSGCNGCADGGWWAGAGWSGLWWNAAVGTWSALYPFTSSELLNGLCGCAGRCQLSSVVLPNPIAGVTQVVINGEILNTNAYRVVNYRRLERIDGGSFPCSNDFTRDSSPGSSDAAGTWQINYVYGRGPGDDGALYAAMLACQFSLAMCGSDGCLLPERTARIVREGVTMELLDPIALMNAGLTGLPLVDAWIREVNPAGIQRRAHFRRLGSNRNNFPTTT